MISKKIKETNLIEEFLVNDIPDYEKTEVLQLNYPSIDIFLYMLEENENIKTKYRSQVGNVNFYGASTVMDAVSIVKGEMEYEGSDDLYNNIINKLLLKGIVGSYYVENYHFDETSGELDISRMLSGETACYLKSNKKYSETYFEIVINIAILARVNSCTYQQNISNILEAVYKAEVEDGLKIKIKLIAMSTSCSTLNMNKKFSVSFIAKNYNEKINLKQLLALFYRSTFRRLIFRTRELVFNEYQDNDYGQSCNNNNIISMNSDKIFTVEEINENFLKQVTFGKANE